MMDFLNYFDNIVVSFPLHLEITYDRTADWVIHIYRKGCGENGSDQQIITVNERDMSVAFAKALIGLKVWLATNRGWC